MKQTYNEMAREVTLVYNEVWRKYNEMGRVLVELRRCIVDLRNEAKKSAVASKVK